MLSDTENIYISLRLAIQISSIICTVFFLLLDVILIFTWWEQSRNKRPSRAVTIFLAMSFTGTYCCASIGVMFTPTVWAVSPLVSEASLSKACSIATRVGVFVYFLFNISLYSLLFYRTRKAQPNKILGIIDYTLISDIGSIVLLAIITMFLIEGRIVMYSCTLVTPVYLPVIFSWVTVS